MNLEVLHVVGKDANSLSKFKKCNELLKILFPPKASCPAVTNFRLQVNQTSNVCTFFERIAQQSDLKILVKVEPG